MADEINLTAEQQAVLQQHVPLLAVMAGAGTGKTTLMTHYIQHAIAKHWAAPREILAVSFTKAATHTLDERLAKLLGDDVASQIATRTFDSFALKQLTDEQHGLVAKVAPHGHVHAQSSDVSVLGAIFNTWKAAQLLAPTMSFKEFSLPFMANNIPTTIRMARLNAYAHQYNQLLLQQAVQGNNVTWYTSFASLYDLSTQILMYLAQQHQLPNLGFKLMIIDEVQDLGIDKVHFLQTLHHLYPQITMVMIGDIVQSIYRFNQADPDSLLQVLKAEHAKIMHLTMNFRSQADVLTVPNLLLRHNFDNITNIQLRAFHDKTQTGTRFVNGGDTECKHFVATAATLNDWHDRGIAYHDMAVLVRNNAIKNKLVTHLQNVGIPLHAGSIAEKGRVLTQRANVAINIIAALNRTVLHQPGGRLAHDVSQQTRSRYYEALSQPLFDSRIHDDSVNLNATIAGIYSYLRDYNLGFNSISMRCLQQHHYFSAKDLATKSVIDLTRWADDVTAWLMAAQQGIEEIVADQRCQKQHGVLVETMHAAKGAEYPYVVILGDDYAWRGRDTDTVLTAFHTIDYNRDIYELRNFGYQLNISPAALAAQNPNDANIQAVLRRWHDQQDLMYVALTRAKCQNVIITSMSTRHYLQRKYPWSLASYQRNIPLEAMLSAGYMINDKQQAVIDMVDKQVDYKQRLRLATKHLPPITLPRTAFN